MKESRNAILLALLSMSMAGGVYAAGSDNSANTGGSSATAMQKSGTAQNASEERTWERGHRASKIIGTNVYDTQGRKIGDIKDVVLNPERGSIDYAVVSFGGMMGMGSKYFAVPWKALQANSDGKRYMLNVDKTALQNASGFDKNNWPDMANQQWASDVERFWQGRGTSTGSSSNATGSSGQ